MTTRLRDRRPVLGELFQQGSAKVLLPKHSGMTAVLLNTAGGVTGGDRFTYEAAVGQGADLTLTTQAAERAYRAQPGETGRIDIRLNAEPGARLHWLPQETILFDGCRLERTLRADLAGDAALLAVEAVVLGRAAMGERLDAIHLADRWEVRRDGQLIWADALRLIGDGDALCARPGVLHGNRAVATILYAGADAGRHLAPLRSLLPVTGGASLVREGVLAARLVAPGSHALRQSLIPALEMLSGARLPKPWTI